MRLEKRLTEWVAAGLISREQAEGIRDHERQKDRPWLLYAIAGLGGLAVAVGLVSVVAANWDLISGRVKIATDLLVLAFVGGIFARKQEAWPVWAKDAALLVLYGMTMASIALVGQVYQLGGTARIAMATWSLITFPLMCLGKTPLLAVVWSIGLQTTAGTWLTWLSEPPPRQEGLALALAGLLPWPWLLLGHSTWLHRLRPSFTSVFAAIGWAEVLIAGSIGTSAFYADHGDEPWNALWAALGVGLVLAVGLSRKISQLPAGRWATGLLVLAVVLAFLPARVGAGSWDVLAALCFIALWLVVAFTAHKVGLLGVLNLATAVVGVRIVIVYFEVFGSLLDTGLGLISGGGLTLGLVWLWWRKKRDFSRSLAVAPKETP